MDFSSKRNFIFDLDGTLIDSTPAHERAFLVTLENLRPDKVSDFSYARIRGQSTSDAFLSLGIIDPNEIRHLVESKQKLYREYAAGGAVEVFPRAIELLGYLRARGNRLFVATSSSKLSAMVSIRRYFADDFFEGIVTGDEVVRGKPAPDIFLEVLGRWSLLIAESVVIEDAEAGAAAAAACKLDVVLVQQPTDDFSKLRFSCIGAFEKWVLQHAA